MLVMSSQSSYMSFFTSTWASCHHILASELWCQRHPSENMCGKPLPIRQLVLLGAGFVRPRFPDWANPAASLAHFPELLLQCVASAAPQPARHRYPGLEKTLLLDKSTHWAPVGCLRSFPRAQIRRDSLPKGGGVACAPQHSLSKISNLRHSLSGETGAQPR